jgi:hypothetical protein
LEQVIDIFPGKRQKCFFHFSQLLKDTTMKKTDFYKKTSVEIPLANALISQFDLTLAMQ